MIKSFVIFYRLWSECNIAGEVTSVYILSCIAWLFWLFLWWIAKLFKPETPLLIYKGKNTTWLIQTSI